MVKSQEFNDLPVLGDMAPELAIAKLRELGEDEVANVLEPATHGGHLTAWPTCFRF